ncbi:hypothetical protein ACUUMB_15150 [Enterobacter kobei]
MTQFSSKSNAINASGIVGGGHPAVIHNWSIPAGLVIRAGQVLAKPFGGDVTVWDGAAPGGEAGGLTATSTAISTADSSATSTVTQDATTKDVSAVDTDVTTTVETEVVTTISGAAGGSGMQLAIAVNDTQDGDTGVIVLIHGCYLYSRALVGDAQPTVVQCDQLSAAGLYPENVW